MKHNVPLHRLFLLLIVLSCPLFCGEALAQSRSAIAQSSSSGSSKYTINDNNQKFSLETNGKITISDDEKSISAISPGGYLKIEKTTFGNSRSLFITSKGSALDYEYKEGGRTKPFEPDGRIWLSEMLPELLSTTTIAADSRVDRLYAKGGARSVLGAFPQLKGDHVKSSYFSLLLKKNLNPSEISAVVDAVPSNLTSDHFMYEVYKTVPPTYFQDVNQLTKAVSNMKSDHFKAQLLTPIFKSNVLAGKGEKALQLINLVSSDHFKLEIAKSISFESMSIPELKFMVEDVLPKISSDHFQSELLKSAMKTDKLSEERALLIASAVKSMQSDHFKAEVLKQLCSKTPTDRVKQQIRETAKTSIKSSHFLGEVMRCAA
jgi:hypothetical protein